MRVWVPFIVTLISIIPAHAMAYDEGRSTFSLGTSPSWSPDGRLIAYQGSDYNIWVMFSDGTDQRRLTEDIYRDEQPVFSPNGELLAYVSEHGGRQDIWIMGSDGSWKKQLTTGSGWKHSPTWSPDGTQLAYIISPERNGKGDIWIMDISTLTARRLTQDGSIRSVTWNPVDGRLGFLSIEDDSYDVHLLDPVTGDDELLLRDTYWKGKLAWSPDGKRMAFVAYRDENYDIWILEDSEFERVTSKKSWQVSPAWSPDGKRMAYSSDENGVYEIWVTSVDAENIPAFEEKKTPALAEVPLSNLAPEAEPLIEKSSERFRLGEDVPVLQLSGETTKEEIVTMGNEPLGELITEDEPQKTNDYLRLILAAAITLVLALLYWRLPLRVTIYSPSPLRHYLSVPLKVFLFFSIK